VGSEDFGYPVCDDEDIPAGAARFVHLMNGIARRHFGGRIRSGLPTRTCRPREEAIL
jgi:hypothetical protein